MTSWQTGTALGIAFSAIVPLIAYGWRFQIASSFVPSAILLVLVYTGSESPRWLAKKRRYSEAYSVLLRLRENKILAARDLVQIREQLKVEIILFMPGDDAEKLGTGVPRLEDFEYDRETGYIGYGRRLRQLFTIGRVRRSTLASSVVMLAQQLR